MGEFQLLSLKMNGQESLFSERLKCTKIKSGCGVYVAKSDQSPG